MKTLKEICWAKFTHRDHWRIPQHILDEHFYDIEERSRYHYAKVIDVFTKVSTFLKEDNQVCDFWVYTLDCKSSSEHTAMHLARLDYEEHGCGIRPFDPDDENPLVVQFLQNG